MSDTKKIVDFAMEELKKTVAQIQSGQKPSSPRKLRKLIKKIAEANKVMKEEDFNKYIKNIADKIEEKK